jgi:hypothetical protein
MGYISRASGGQYVLAATIITVGSLVLTGCSDEGKVDGSKAVASVASAPRPAASASVSSTFDDNGRPLIRVDASVEDEDRLWAAWYKCLNDQGVPGGTKGAIKVAKFKDTKGMQTHLKEVKACRGKEPEREQDRLERTDPTRHADLDRETDKCMKKRGIELDKNGDLVDPSKMAGAMEIASQCEKEAYLAN